MNKLMCGMVLAMAAFAGAPLAQAAGTFLPDNVYVASSIGAHIGNKLNKGDVWIQQSANIDDDKGYSVSLAVGYRWDDFRFELEGGYGLLAESEGPFPAALSVTPGFRPYGDVKMWTAMAGAYYDFPVTAIYQPYIGLGLGVADIDSEADLLLIDQGANLAGFLEAGLNMRLMDGLALAPAYRYLRVRGGGSYADVATHLVKMGIRGSF